MGHDVVALDEHLVLEGLADPAVLSLAAAEGRILVTFNVRDFAPHLQEWAEAGRGHAGCVLVVGLNHGEIGPVVKRLSTLLNETGSWESRAVFLSRSTGSALDARRGL
jgi:Domain of unknown function (DUF5615)